MICLCPCTCHAPFPFFIFFPPLLTSTYTTTKCKWGFERNQLQNECKYKKVVPTPPFCTKRPLAGILYCSPSPQLKFEGGSIYKEKAIKWAIVWLLLRLAASNLCQTSRMSSSEVRNYAKHGSHGIWYHMLLIWSMKVPKKERIEFSKRHSLLTQPDCKR